jgi:hypothetical protein
MLEDVTVTIDRTSGIGYCVSATGPGDSVQHYDLESGGHTSVIR